MVRQLLLCSAVLPKRGSCLDMGVQARAIEDTPVIIRDTTRAVVADQPANVLARISGDALNSHRALPIGSGYQCFNG